MSTVLAIIPARRNSKGVPGKNFRELNGKPLILYTVEAARKVFKDDNIYVSTDSPEVQQIVEESGLKLPFLRPEALALDNSGTYEVLLHALDHAEKNGLFPDYMVVLQPTSPFRTEKHIEEAVQLYLASAADMVAAVKETESNPYYVLFEEEGDGYLTKSKKGSFSRRQDCPMVWEFNGSIYVINIKSLKAGPPSGFKKVKKYVMDSISSLDIDTVLDWKLAEVILTENNDGKVK